MNEPNPFASEALATTNAEAKGRAQRLSSGVALFVGGVAGAVTGLILNVTNETKGWRRPAMFSAAAAAAGLVIANLTWYLKPKHESAVTTQPESDVLVLRPGAEPAPIPEPKPSHHTARLETAREQAQSQPSPTI